MKIGSGIAIAGIWIAVAVMAFASADVAALAGYAALPATIIIVMWS